MKAQYYGQVYIAESGKKRIKLLNPDQVDIDIDRYEVGDRVVMTIETLYRKRSPKQNRLVHAYYNIISEHTGHSAEEVKDMMKFKFLRVPMTSKEGEEVVDVDSGEVEMIIRETRSLTTTETMEYADKIRGWSERVINCYLPLPEENIKLNLK